MFLCCVCKMKDSKRMSLGLCLSREYLQNVTMCTLKLTSPNLTDDQLNTHLVQWLCWRMSVRESTTEIVEEIMEKTEVIGWQIGVSCSVRCWDNYEPAGGTKHCHICPIEVSLSNILNFTSTRGSALQRAPTSLLTAPKTENHTVVNWYVCTVLPMFLLVMQHNCLCDPPFSYTFVLTR